jgi:ribosomal protein S18 acetylase RimI-like enzyme
LIFIKAYIIIIKTLEENGSKGGDNMSYVIRMIEDHELEECAAVIRAGFLTVAEDFGITKENAPTNGAFLQAVRLFEEKTKGHFMYAAVQEAKIIGYMQMEKSTPELYFLQKLVVLPEYRHMGIGRALLDFAKEKVAEWKGNKISIGIIEENTVLKDWYLSYGFEPTATRKFEHLPFTVGFMELKLI